MTESKLDRRQMLSRRDTPRVRVSGWSTYVEENGENPRPTRGFAR